MRKSWLLRGVLNGAGMAASMLFLADLAGAVRWAAIAICVATSLALLVLNLRAEAP